MRPTIIFAIVAFAVLLISCGGTTSSPAPTISATVVVADQTDSPPTPTATTAVKTATPTEAPPSPTATAAIPATVVVAPTLAPARPPNSGRWIDVDVSQFVVRLMDGTNATATIGPVAVGEQVDTGIYNSTATGLFHVYSKTAALTYDAPYSTYISDWVGFDPGLDNGFHSFLKNAEGKVVDASTGHVSNGCIRTGEPGEIYEFAQMGMPVYVHS